jgi:protein-disulfide isomerase
MEMFGDQVNFTYRPLALVSEHSEVAAIAAQCAREQCAFWICHDIL